jgi:hypothetical protein
VLQQQQAEDAGDRGTGVKIQIKRAWARLRSGRFGAWAAWPGRSAVQIASLDLPGISAPPRPFFPSLAFQAHRGSSRQSSVLSPRLRLSNCKDIASVAPLGIPAIPCFRLSGFPLSSCQLLVHHCHRQHEPPKLGRSRLNIPHRQSPYRASAHGDLHDIYRALRLPVIPTSQSSKASLSNRIASISIHRADSGHEAPTLKCAFACARPSNLHRILVAARVRTRTVSFPASPLRRNLPVLRQNPPPWHAYPGSHKAQKRGGKTIWPLPRARPRPKLPLGVQFILRYFHVIETA